MQKKYWGQHYNIAYTQWCCLYANKEKN